MVVSCWLRLPTEGFPLRVDLAVEFLGMNYMKEIELFSMQDTFRVRGALRRDTVRGRNETSQDIVKL